MPNDISLRSDAKENGIQSDQHFAAVDLGSNSFHLIVARFVDGALQPLVRDKQIVRLADGMGRERKLTPEAISRALDVLKGFANTLNDIPPSSIRVVATYALRRASNRREFLRLAHRFFPLPIEVISGDEEARLIYQGVAHTTPFDGRRLVVDIGGGSTELAIGEQFMPLELSSLQMGCVSFTDKFFAEGEITEKAFARAEIAAAQRVELVDQRFRRCGWDTALGTSGTARALAAFLNPDHETAGEAEISLKTLFEIKRRLLSEGHVKNIVEVEESRRAVLPAGLSILIAIFKQLKIDRMHVSEAALREGVLYELNARMRHIDIRQRTIDSFKARYYVDEDQATRVQATALNLLAQVRNLVPATQFAMAKQFLVWASAVHEIGLNINRRQLQTHSGYIIQHSEMPGFSVEEQAILAFVVSRHRKRTTLKRLPTFELLKPRAITILVLVLRLATLLHIRRIDGFVPEIQIQVKGRELTLLFPIDWLEENPLVQADLDNEAQVLEGNTISLRYR